MQSPELQETTASEPLTIEQEYEMQQTWLNSDDSKNIVFSKKEYTFLKHCIFTELTFIVLDRNVYEKNPDDETGKVNLFSYK